MKEIRDILLSYAKATADGKKTALATVVKVEGSSYRRPGARMLITEDGQLTGAISGGCLEGDALRKALSAIVQQQNKLVTYDTTDEDDAKFGVQLGCNGIVHILFEPLIATAEQNPISLLTALQTKRSGATLVTIFSLNESQQLGTSLLVDHDRTLGPENSALKKLIFEDARRALTEKQTTFNTYSFQEKSITAFIEYLNPPIALVIAGAGNDAQPLAALADLIGWQTTIADGRPGHATAMRFPTADRVLISKPENLLDQLEIDDQTAFVLMTHNYNYDLALLNELLKKDVRYIGVLGPKKKLLRMLTELEIVDSQTPSNVHGPVGLDIGAETAEEIALSIASEIKTVFSGASGKLLKNKVLPIHQFDTNQ
jgi:xanthine dehydrogenase accessory factor